METWESNPYSLEPKSTALPIKLVSMSYFWKGEESSGRRLSANIIQYESAKLAVFQKANCTSQISTSLNTNDFKKFSLHMRSCVIQRKVFSNFSFGKDDIRLPEIRMS